MGKYSDLETDIYGIFATAAWADEGILTVPANVGITGSATYVRLSIIPSGKGLNLGSVSGLLNIDIFAPVGKATLDVMLIADTLDAHLVGKKLSKTQFGNSTLADFGRDAEDPALYRTIYSIPFNHFGVS